MDDIKTIIIDHSDAIGNAEMRITQFFIASIICILIYLVRYLIWVRIEKSRLNNIKTRSSIHASIVGSCVIGLVVSILVAMICIALFNNPNNLIANFVIAPFTGFMVSVIFYHKLLSTEFSILFSKKEESSKSDDKNNTTGSTQIIINTNSEVDSQPNKNNENEHIDDETIDELKKISETVDPISKEDIENPVKYNIILFKQKINSIIDNEKVLSKTVVENTQTINKLKESDDCIIELLQEIKEKVHEMKSSMEERDAIQSRVRILRFNDELLLDVKHSKESFDQCLRDIDIYDSYCATHKDFKNSMTVFAEENIRKSYKKCMESKSFLM